MTEIFQRLLAARGIGGEFLRPEYENCSETAAAKMPDMGKAVQRILRAAKEGEKVLIYGDYDVDGVTASTVMHDALRLTGVRDIEIMLPNRFLDGYGMSTKIVQRAKDRVNLVLTVDCGSRNNEIIEELAAAGIDTIVTDHHECGAVLPKAVAVVNPKRKDVKVSAELRELAGVGVAFKVAEALVEAGGIPAGQEKWLLDLVLIGTICDSMRIGKENRRLCYYGMKVLEKTRRAGLKELMRLAGVKRLDGEAIGYQIGPRLNAAGRMDTAETALKLLMAEKKTEVAALAARLEELNNARKSQQNAAVREIQKRGLVEGRVIVETGDWHEGVLGIIAGRLTEEYQRPAFVLSSGASGPSGLSGAGASEALGGAGALEGSGLLKGSGRSFGEFNLAEALDACREYLEGGGGHAEACGVKLKAKNLERFRAAINQYYDSLKLENQERFLAIHEDLAIEDFSELTLELVEELKGLEPYGPGNEEPVFLLPEVRIVEASRLGADEQHLRLLAWDRQNRGLKLMKFYAKEEELRIRGGETANVWVRLVENEFRGVRSVEGRILALG